MFPQHKVITGIEGEWVLTVDGEVVAHTMNNREIFKIAEKYKNNKNAIVTKIFHANNSF